VSRWAWTLRRRAININPAPTAIAPTAICVVRLESEPVVGSAAGGGTVTMNVVLTVPPVASSLAVVVYVPGIVGAVNVAVALGTTAAIGMRKAPAGPLQMTFTT
jgi:hypothetical protein